MTTQPVLFDELATGSAMKIGVATLNNPATLNGLSLAMCELLTERLLAWRDDDSIAFVLLQGAGEKAFSAGGDLHGLYQGMLANSSGDPWANTHASRFFDIEYRLDYLIHTFPKPIVCWGSGIVMGGGVGLFMGASHRVVSDTTRFVMPEISIGLFPDVGGTWMLSRLPDGVGNFLAFTGAQLGATDTQALGLSDFIVPTDQWQAFLDAAMTANWGADPVQNDTLLRHLLQAQSPAGLEPGPLQRHLDLVRQTCGGRDFNRIVQALAALAQHDDPWLQKAVRTFKAGSPGSARLSFTLLQRARFMSLADVFRQEYIVSLQCGVQGDFQEGIRALLIDKDKSPKWNPATPEQATAEWVERFFRQPWPADHAHPLADLGQAN